MRFPFFSYILFVLCPEKPLHTLQFLSPKIWLGLKQGEKTYIDKNFSEEPVNAISKGKFNIDCWSLMLILIVQVGQISITWLFRKLDKNSVKWYCANSILAAIYSVYVLKQDNTFASFSI